MTTTSTKPRLHGRALTEAIARARAIATAGHKDDLPTVGSETPTKLNLVKAHYLVGQYKEALAIAARFPQLGKEADAIRLGHEAYTHPAFYEQLGKNVAEMKSTAIAALGTKYGWPMQLITHAELNPGK